MHICIIGVSQDLQGKVWQIQSTSSIVVAHKWTHGINYYIMDYEEKLHIERLIKKRIGDLVQIAHEQYRDSGPMLGTMIVLVVSEFKEELLSTQSPLLNAIDASKEDITEWIDNLFRQEIKKYVQL